MIVLDTSIFEESLPSLTAPFSDVETMAIPPSLLRLSLFELVDKVFESSDSKTSSLDRETLDESLSTFESLDTEISDESAVFSSGTDASDVSSTKLVAYESVTLTSLAEIALAVKTAASNINKVSNIRLFKLIYLHNNFSKHQQDENLASTIFISNILYKPFYLLNPIK